MTEKMKHVVTLVGVGFAASMLLIHGANILITKNYYLAPDGGYHNESLALLNNFFGNAFGPCTLGIASLFVGVGLVVYGIICNRRYRARREPGLRGN